jgi:hypothetical protein
MNERTARWMLVVILVLFVVFGLAYALTTPTLEAPDEIHHYNYIRSLVNTGRPPVLEEGAGRGFGHHAPLYYAAGALASFWVGEEDLEAWSDRHNPFFGYEFGEVGRDNKNLYLHPDDDTFGTSDTWLGIRVVRAVSVLMGACTVFLVYLVGREVFPERPEMAVGAAGLAAFIPEFLFISGAVNDDNGASLFGALSLLLLMRLLRRGPSLARCIGLGLALGLGWLSKLTTFALVPTAGVVVALLAWRRRSWADLFRWGAVVLIVAAVLIVPWLVRQTLLYGDPTGTAREMTEWGLRDQPVTLADLIPDLYWLRTSFWGRLGYNQVPLSTWIYDLLDAVSLISILGLVRLVVRRRRRARAIGPHPLGPGTVMLQIGVLALSILLVFGPMVVRRFLRPMPNFGRYLFPVLPAIALLMFVGLAAWLPRRYRTHLAIGVTLAMLALGVSGLLFYLAPAYERPEIYDLATAPEPTYQLDRIYLDLCEGDCEEGELPLARLLGYDLDQDVAMPGQAFLVTLYWEVLGETSENHVLFAQLFGRGGTRVGQRDTYTGLGHYPTSFWQPGQVIADEVPIPVDPEADAPSLLRLDVGLYHRDTGSRLTVVDTAGEEISSPTVGSLRMSASEDIAPPAFQADYRLGEDIALIGYGLRRSEGELTLTLHWACLAPVELDYTVFAHLTDPAGQLVAQADGPPAEGTYPTSAWIPGEVIAEERVFAIQELTPGTYQILVGMYLLESGERLPAFDTNGESLIDDTVPLTGVELP